MIIRLIIRQEYKARAVELSIKKVLGYSILQKNKKIFIFTLASFIFSLLSSVIGGYFVNKSSIAAIILAAGILFICEICIMVRDIRKIEKTNIMFKVYEDYLYLC